MELHNVRPDLVLIQVGSNDISTKWSKIEHVVMAIDQMCRSIKKKKKTCEFLKFELADFFIKKGDTKTGLTLAQYNARVDT